MSTKTSRPGASAKSVARIRVARENFAALVASAATVLTQQEAALAFSDRPYEEFNPCYVVAHSSMSEVIRAASAFVAVNMPDRVVEFITYTLNQSAERLVERELFSWDVVKPGDVRLVLWK